jgi:hypothetical protein
LNKHLTAKVWNKLPDQVINTPSTNAFKNRLDKYWENEEINCSDHRAEIYGGNRSDIQLQEIDTIGESGEVTGNKRSQFWKPLLSTDKLRNVSL